MRVLIAFALLCSVASAEDIFKPTGIYAVPAEKIQRLSNSIDELQATIDEIKSGAEEIGTAVEATKPIKLTLPKPAVTSATKMTHAEMVVTHNRLHGGGQWTWPGDLETHLRTAHGVGTIQTAAQPVRYTQRAVYQSSCPNGRCPTTTRRTFFRRR